MKDARGVARLLRLRRAEVMQVLWELQSQEEALREVELAIQEGRGECRHVTEGLDGAEDWDKPPHPALLEHARRYGDWLARKIQAMERRAQALRHQCDLAREALEGARRREKLAEELMERRKEKARVEEVRRRRRKHIPRAAQLAF